MCGISGILTFDPRDTVDEALVRRMTAVLSHRGPDDEGFFVQGQIGLGFRRLSIIDLRGGSQPIFNEDNTAAIVFNGEIYNYRDLTATLEQAGHVFRTRSDTETILHAYEEFGDDCVRHLRGMFGFAIWDSGQQRLLLARDRLGVKPLYYYQNERFLAFSSEIKALLEIPDVKRDVDPDALGMYLALRYVPGPRTMFRGIQRLQPGHTMSVSARGVSIQRYWDIEYSEAPIDLGQATRRFLELLEESVRLRLIAEVPLGVFLSGGLDSSAILAMTRRLAGHDRVKTFSVGYEATSAAEEKSNELTYARMAARSLAAEHFECRLAAGDVEHLLPRLTWQMDEPLADPSSVSQYWVSKLAREHVTVVLSGEGADELLAGYNIYYRMLKLDGLSRSLPMLKHLAPLAGLVPSEAVARYLRMAGQSPASCYRGVCRGFDQTTLVRLIGEKAGENSRTRLSELFADLYGRVSGASPLNQMLYTDTKAWLPDDLLTKADKMTMANSLEMRVPFLDHKLVEWAATLPDSAKLASKGGKTLLRNAMRGILPDAIIDRPKKGFPIPIASWLRGPLRAFAQETLLARDAACGRYMDRATIAQLVQQHAAGRQDRSQELWALLTFETWHRQFIAAEAGRRQAA